VKDVGSFVQVLLATPVARVQVSVGIVRGHVVLQVVDAVKRSVAHRAFAVLKRTQQPLEYSIRGTETLKPQNERLKYHERDCYIKGTAFYLYVYLYSQICHKQSPWKPEIGGYIRQTAT
jgi:hypothetical protein